MFDLLCLKIVVVYLENICKKEFDFVVVLVSVLKNVYKVFENICLKMCEV